MREIRRLLIVAVLGFWTVSCGGNTEKPGEVFQCNDGIDNDGDGKVDEYGNDGIDGIAGWWGTCHAWTPASQLVPEPQHSVTVNGVTFEVGDIKALTQNAFDQTAAVMADPTNAQSL